MSSVIITGDTSGAITLAAPAVAGTNTITLPASTGTVATTSQIIGVSQSWSDVTSTRTAGTTYTNSTGKPIMVVGKLTSSASAIATITVDSVVVPGSGNAGNTGFWMTASAIVPNGSSYVYGVNSGTATIVTAVELR